MFTGLKQAPEGTKSLKKANIVKMLKKLFSKSKPGKATALIALTSFLSYALGLFRDRIIAINFGTSSETDIYNASFLIPDLLFNLFIAGALSAAFLPVFSDYLERNKQEAFKLAHTMLSMATITITTLALISYTFMPEIISLSFSNIGAEMQSDIVSMTRIMLLSAVIFAISNTVGNILMSYKHFFAYSLSPIFYNLGIIIGVTVFEGQFGIHAAAIGVVAGATLHCLIRVIDSFFTGYRYKAQIHLRHEGFKKILKLMLPKSLSLIAWQVNLYIFAIVGIKMQEGGLAAFHFARNIQSFAVSLFGISFATAIFPFLANSALEESKEKYTAHIQKTIQRMLFFTLPAALGLMTLSKPIVELILSGGIFDQDSIAVTSIILYFFAISIPFESLSHIFARAFYALKNTLTPMIINISSMILMACITIFLAPKLGIQWFSIAFSIGFITYICISIVLLRKHLEKFDTRAFTRSILKTIVATLIMTIVVLNLDILNTLIPGRLLTIIKIATGAFIYLFTAYLLKSPELSSVNFVLSRIIKKKQV